MDAVRTFRNTTYMLLGHVISALILFFANALVARHLGVEDYGTYSFAISFCYLFIAIGNLGMDQLLIREMAKYPKKAPSFLVASFYLKLFLSLISIGILLVSVYFMPLDMKTKYAILFFSANVLLVNWNFSFQSYFTSRLEMFFFFLSETFGKILYLILVLYLLKINAGLNSFVFIHVLMYFVQVIFYFIFLMKRKFPFSIDKSLCYTLLKGSLPFALLSLFSTLYARVDTLMLEFIKGSESVGYYSSAFTVANGLTIFATAISVSLYPVLSYYWKKDKRKFIFALNAGFKYLFVIGIFFFIFLSFLRNEIISIIYGESYLAASNTFALLLLVTFFIFIISIFDLAFIAAGREDFPVKVIAVSLLLKGIFNFIFITRLDYFGAALASVFTDLIMLVIYFINLRKLVKFSFDVRTYYSFFAVSIGCLWFFAPFNLIFSILFSLVSVAILLYAFKVFNEQEIGMIKNAIFKFFG